MALDRLPMLRSMVAARPDEPFPRYGLAMELAKREQLDEAIEQFETLMDAHPDYVPTYLMFGNLLSRAGQPTRAATVLDRGIEVAARVGDEHACGELQAARAELP